MRVQAESIRTKAVQQTDALGVQSEYYCRTHLQGLSTRDSPMQFMAPVSLLTSKPRILVCHCSAVCAAKLLVKCLQEKPNGELCGFA